jgi:hypothetical protein
MKKIGVQKGLTNISEHLTRNGYSVHEIGESLDNSAVFHGLDAIVTTDYNTDMMGFSDAATRIPVINASGLSAEDVKNLVNQRVGK